MEKVEKVAIVGFLLLVLGYGLFHVGRLYEQRQAQKVLNKAWEYSSDTYYLVEDGRDYSGEWVAGRCLTPTGEETILNYAPVDFQICSCQLQLYASQLAQNTKLERR